MSLNVPDITRWGPVCHCGQAADYAHRHGTRDGVEWIAVLRPPQWSSIAWGLRTVSTA